MSRTDASTHRRQVILSTALACFAARGVAATTMEDIHRLAPASIGSIYHHFVSKELLARTVYLEGLQAFYGALLADLRHYETAQGGIEALVRFEVSRIALPSGWLRRAGASHELWPDAATDQLVVALEQEFASDLGAWLGPHIQRGDLLRLPIAFYLAILFGPAQHLAENWVRGYREQTLEAAQQALAAAAWTALHRTAAVGTC